MEIVKIFRRVNKLVFMKAETRREKTFSLNKEGIQNSL